MAAEYPGSVYSPRAKENRSGVEYDADKKSVIFVEDISKLDDEVVAIETELGADPKGDYASVAAFLAALAAKTIFTDFLDLLNWQSLDGYTAVVSTDCLVTPNANEVDLYVEGTANKHAIVYTKAMYIFPLTAGKLITVEFQITKFDSIDPGNVWLGFGMPWDNPPDDDNDFIGFVIKNGVIYGRCGNDGSHTDETTGITIDTGVQRTRLRIVFNPTVDCKFYVDDVLKATITTHLKAYENCRIYMAVKMLVSTANHLFLGRVLIQKVY